MRPLTAVLAVAAPLAFVVQPASAQESVHGAWQIVETWGHNPQEGEWRTESVQPSAFLFMDGYYSIAYVRGEESRPLMPEGATREDLTPEHAAAVWIPYVSNSGSYELTPSMITLRRIVAVNPNIMGGSELVYLYRLEDGVLHLSAAGDDWSWQARLDRLP